jgi:hypothetical protein
MLQEREYRKLIFVWSVNFVHLKANSEWLNGTMSYNKVIIHM